MGIGAVAVAVQGAEEHHRGLHRVRREHRLHLQGVDVVPLAQREVAEFEIVVEFLLAGHGQGRELFQHRGAHQPGGVVGDAVVGEHERGQAAKVVVVGVGVEDAGDLIDADAQGVQAGQDIRPGVDEVDLALEDDDAGHGRAVGIPAVALAGMHHREVVALDVVEAQHIGGVEQRLRRGVQVHADRVLSIIYFELVGLDAFDVDPVADLLAVVLHHHEVEVVLHAPDLAEGELELQAHPGLGVGRIGSGGQHLLLGHQTVVAPVDVLHLRFDLLARADERGLDPGVVGVSGDDAALAVEDLQDGELGEVGEAAVLDQFVGEQDGVGPGFEADAVDLDVADQAALHQVLDAVRRAPAQDVHVDIGNADVINSFSDLDLGDLAHAFPGV